ncbi:MAG: alanine--tRNA ligase, partial [Oscillospiraceae bacterium]|nr:alanine--tRNA ligase [Oscillospiraceae bacterium]
YPELVRDKVRIVKTIRAEEESFAKTINGGLVRVNELLDSLTAAGKTVFPGDEAFKLYDTFGFPIDLTRELCEERGLTVDEETYKKLMTEQRETAREATRAALGDVAWTEDVLSSVEGGKTFVGYETLTGEGSVLAIVKDGALVDALSEGDSAEIVLCSTPFYAESGGQVGDTGVLTVGDSEFEVLDCKKSSLGHWMHIGRMVKGGVRTGDTVTAKVDAARRSAIKRNHTSAHLLQAALREVLGDHVRQAGSYVDENYMRFDFTHFEAVKPEELRAVEALVNEKILAGIPVDTRVMSVNDAQQMGAMALFGEKYGDTVRVVCVDEFSKEFCGGTHAENTAQLGLYRIVSESSVAAGVRRIESVTGTGVLRLLDEQKALLDQTASVLKVGSVKELPAKAASNIANIKALENEIAKMREKEAQGALKDIAKTGESVGAFTFFSANVGAVQADELRRMATSLRDGAENTVVLLASVDGGKATLCAACSKQAIAAGIKAGALVRAAAQAMGGSGGGKDDIAMAGGKQPEKVNEAFAAAKAVVAAL